MTLAELNQKNPHIEIKAVTDESFFKYGNILTGYDFSQMLQVMENKPVPVDGNVYVAADSDLMAVSETTVLSDGFYGHMPIQIGYCNGNSCQLNALEYHKGTEIDVAATDLVLLLSITTNIQNNTLSSDKVEAFFVPAGTAVELFGTTLHFAPCALSDTGFKSIVILPEGTNAPLTALPTPKCKEDQLLWMQNKWLIAHPDSIPASKGACAGITGDNIRIYY